MPDQFGAALTFLGLLDGAVLYGRLIRRRVHERRIQARLSESAHLYGLVRVMLADQRSPDSA
jgi:hypothetical protein